MKLFGTDWGRGALISLQPAKSLPPPPPPAPQYSDPWPPQYSKPSYAYEQKAVISKNNRQNPLIRQ